MRKLLVAGLVGTAALVLNPAAGCGKSFSFGEQEMSAAVEGTWKLSVPARGDDPAYEVTLLLSQSRRAVPQASIDLVSSAHACGTRSLVKSAGACLDTTKMPLDVKIVASAPEVTNASAKGLFRVNGTDFRTGMLEIKFLDDELSAVLSPTGVAESAELIEGGEYALRKTVELVRVAK